MDKKIQSIFVVCPNWVGDFIMCTPSLNSLRKKYPQAQITLCLRSYLRYLAEGASYYDHMISYDKSGEHKGIGGWRKIAKEIQRSSYDLAVIFPNSIRTGILSFLSRAKKRVGYARFGKFLFFTDTLIRERKNGKYVHVYTGDHYAKLMGLLEAKPESLYPELPLKTETKDRAQQIWTKATQNPSGLNILMTPGASFGISKLWPGKHWAKLIDLLWEKYNANIILAPGPADGAITKEIQDQAQSPFFTQPPIKEGLTILKGIIAQSDLVICPDTGPRHIAHAFRIPSIVLMGPNDPKLTYTPLENTTVVRNAVPCSPCQLKVCPYAHHACMQELFPETVLENAEKMLEKENKI